LKRVVYLVEGIMDPEFNNEKLESAMTETQIEDGFFVYRTEQEEQTVSYLMAMTKHFIEANTNHALEWKTLFTFDDFLESMDKSKNLTLTDLFAKQLLQFPYCTSEKVAAIVGVYSTPKRLREVLETVELDKRGDFLKNMEYGTKRRKIGPALSRIVCKFYSELPDFL